MQIGFGVFFISENIVYTRKRGEKSYSGIYEEDIPNSKNKFTPKFFAMIVGIYGENVAYVEFYVLYNIHFNLKVCSYIHSWKAVKIHFSNLCQSIKPVRWMLE